MLKCLSMDQQRLRPADFFVLRAPRLPATTLHEWAAGLDAEDRDGLRARLRSIVARPEVKEAILVASPSLATRIPKWEANPDSKDGRKIEHAIIRYVERMAARSTPFGMFAGCSIGRVGERLSLTVSPDIQRHARLDMGCVVAIAEALEQRQEIRAALTYRPSPSLHEVGGRLHVPALVQKEEGRSYALEAITIDDALRTALENASGGVTREKLAATFDDPDALTYVDSLIDAGVLESTLAPPLTGKDPLTALAEALPGVTSLEALRGKLAELEQAVDSAAFSAIEQGVRDLAPKADTARAVQLDMMRPVSTATIDAATQARIGRAIELAQLTTPRFRLPALTHFAKRFSEKYGQREIPLAEAIDEEIGLGFSAPEHDEDQRRSFETMLLEKLETAWSTNAASISFSKDELSKLEKEDRDPLPASLGALVTLLADDRVLLHSVSGASAARLLGRFCPWSEELTELVRAHHREEESARPDAIYAEIAHLPIASRHANVILRPLLRDWEIAFCGRSGASAERTLGIADLVVSVTNGRVILRSRKLGREVIPRLSSAHNTNIGLTVYRFLAALATQQVAAGLSWGWGRFANARTLPSVEHDGCILSPRTWNLDAREVASLKTFQSTRALRQTRGLPRWVGIQDGDNVLPIDLDNVLSIEAAASTLSDKTTVRLVELYLDQLVAEGEGGAYAHELVVPFIHASSPVVQVARPQTTPTAKRTFAPGGEWLFAKIYVARSSIDFILTEVCKPLVKNADQWFFIRYDDPEPHVRLRIHGSAAKLNGKVLPDLQRRLEPLLAAGRVQRLELGTYDREIERYGGDAGIDLAETIFHADSEAAVALAQLELGSDQSRDYRHAVLLGMHRIYDDFDLDAATRVKIETALVEGFMKEQNITPERERTIAGHVRAEKTHYTRFLEAPPAELDAIFTRRSNRSRRPAQALRMARRAGKLTVSTEGMVDSLIHMWCNRVLRTNARAQELVLHTLLLRYYESLVARARSKGKKAA